MFPSNVLWVHLREETSECTVSAWCVLTDWRSPVSFNSRCRCDRRAPSFPADSSHALSLSFPLPLVLILNFFGLTPVKPLAEGQSFFSSLDLLLYQTWREPQSLAHPQLIPEIRYGHFNRSWPPLHACLFQGTLSQFVQSLMLKLTQVSVRRKRLAGFDVLRVLKGPCPDFWESKGSFDLPL